MDILTSNYVNESFINPSYSERMGLTYRQAKGKLTLKDKIRLKLMKYLGKSREGLAAKLQDKSLKAAGYAIRKKDAFMATNPDERFIKFTKEGFKSGKEKIKQASQSETGQKIAKKVTDTKNKAKSKLQNVIDSLRKNKSSNISS